MTKKTLVRIAFVCEELNYFTRQIAVGVSRYAMPANGFITREFVIPWEDRRLPPSLRSWEPDAIITFVAAEDSDILKPLIEQGLPIVSTARAEPTPYRAVVLGDAKQVYRTATQHFESLGITSIWFFARGDPRAPSPFSREECYRQYTQERGLPCNIFWRPQGMRFDEIQKSKELDTKTLRWLFKLQKPVGIFSTQTSEGYYLCRLCEFLDIKVPDQVALIGFDGLDTATASNPPVTSICIHGRNLGFEAARLAVAILRGKSVPKQVITVKGLSLIPRQSTRLAFVQACDIDRAVEFIDRHACEGIKVQDVMSHTQNVSRVTFHKRFLEQTGLTPAQMILEKKMGEAKRLLSETEISPGSVAGMCGYCDYIHFYRTFCAETGVSPIQYRRLYD